MYFFERTAQDSACFIDIEEKNTRLRSWEVIERKKKRNIKNKLARLDWNINTGYFRHGCRAQRTRCLELCVPRPVNRGDIHLCMQQGRIASLALLLPLTCQAAARSRCGCVHPWASCLPLACLRLDPIHLSRLPIDYSSIVRLYKTRRDPQVAAAHGYHYRTACHSFVCAKRRLAFCLQAIGGSGYRSACCWPS
jgi:hypothetical protein